MNVGILLAAVAAAEPVGAEGLPVVVEAGDGWRASVRAARSLTVARDAPPAEFALAFEPGVQLDLARTPPDEARAMLVSELGSVGAHLRWSEVTVERRDHPVLGPLFVLATDGQVEGAADPVRMRFATWSGPAGQLTLGGGVYADPTRADALFAEALGRLGWREPPLPPEGFTWGHAALDGYALDLPEGWRLAHPHEPLGLSPGQALAFDPATRAHGGLACVTNPGPLEVVEGYTSRFVARARAILAGGAPGLRDARRAVDPQAEVQRGPVRVEEPGTVEAIALDDRDGYRWRVAGKVGEASVQVALVYTTFGDRAVDCLYLTPDGEIPAAVLDALRSLRITSGGPPVCTWMGEYLRRRPFRHPLLQVWWLGAVLLAGAVALVARRLA